MTVEIASYPGQLDPQYPAVADFKSEGPAHFSLIKKAIIQGFPNVLGKVNATHTQLDYVLRAMLTPIGETQLILPVIAARASRLMAFGAGGEIDVSRSLAAFDADVLSTSNNAGTATGAAQTCTTQAGIATGAAEQSALARDFSQKWATQSGTTEVVPGQGYSAKAYAAAAGQASIDAGTARGQAQSAAAAAAASAAQAGLPISGTSTDSLPIQPGALTINVGTGKGFVEGQYVVIARPTEPTTAMRGLVTGYTNSGAGPLAVTVDKAEGTGTFASWKVGLAGRDAAGSSRTQVPVTTATVTAEQGKDYILQFAGVVTVTMPAAPVWGGASIGIVVANGRADNLVAWNGSKHMGLSDTTTTLNSAFAAPELLPTGATYGWAIK